MHSVSDNGNGNSNVPAFLAKLWKLVDNPSTDNLIRWNQSGLSFTIREQACFARELLPLYYKHNNMASFVRQLNMYGFHKVTSVDSGALKVDKDEMEFAHTYFLRGHEYLLEHIKRKIPISKQQEETKVKPEMMSKVLCDVRSMKGKQDTLDSRLTAMKKENEALWREVASLRQKHLKQQQIVNKLIQFLITVVQPNGRAGLGAKRHYPLMLQEVAHSAKEAELNAKNENLTENVTSFSACHQGVDFSQAPTLESQTPGGPIIHDVTDLVDDPGDDGVVEIPIDQEDEISYMSTSSIITEASEANDVAPRFTVATGQFNSGFSPNRPQPDLSVTGTQLGTGDESSTDPGSLLTPETLPSVNAGEGGTLEAKLGRLLKPKLRLCTTAPLQSREDLDNHLDAMQMDLDNLREFLSLQNETVDPRALLGVCEIMGLNEDPVSSMMSPKLVDQCFSKPIQRSLDPKVSPQPQMELANVNLKVFGASESTMPESFPSGDHVTQTFTLTNPGVAAANQLVTYNPSFFELADDGDNFISTASMAASSGPSTTTELEDFLGLDNPVPVNGPAAKRMRS